MHQSDTLSRVSLRRAYLLTAAVTTTVGLLLGSVGGTAWACDDRGKNLRETWDLEITAVEFEGDPRVQVLVEVGGVATLHRGGKERNEVVLSNPGMIFSKVSE